MDPTGRSTGEGLRTPHGVRIDRQRELHRSRAMEELRRKQCAGARGRKRGTARESDSLFVQSDDDLDEEAAPASAPSTLAVDASEAVEHSPPGPQGQPEQKKVKPNPKAVDDLGECTCAISTDCPRKARLGLRDCRSLAPIPRKTTAKAKQERAPKKLISTSRKGKNQRLFQDLSEFMAQFRKIVAWKSGDETTAAMKVLRDRLEKLMFFAFPPDAETSRELERFLDTDTGIPQLFDCSLLPWYMKDDARAIFDRWSEGDLDYNLLRGIDIRSGTTTGKKTTMMSRALTYGYKFKKASDFVGEGHLHNGQWFPYQICAVRDGAHGDHEAGIFGKVGTGALSIVLSSGRTKGYADIDEGEEISYCGTRGKDSTPTAGTNLMLESLKTKNPIRVLRSAKLTGKFKPELGLRYDGLYEVQSMEPLDEATALYRFRLTRLDNQYPIRYTGYYKRPNQREVEEFQELKALLKGSK